MYMAWEQAVLVEVGRAEEVSGHFPCSLLHDSKALNVYIEMAIFAPPSPLCSLSTALEPILPQLDFIIHTRHAVMM